MSLRSPIGKVLGSGSAKEGVHHWWLQRLTSIALVPLDDLVRRFVALAAVVRARDRRQLDGTELDGTAARRVHSGGDLAFATRRAGRRRRLRPWWL